MRLFFITLNFLVVLQRCQLIVNNQLIMYQPELLDPNASLVLILIWLLIIMIFFLCVFVSFSEHPELPDPYASFLITLNFCSFYLTATGHVFYMFFPKDQLPVIYFLKLKVCTDLWYFSHCRQRGQSESTRPVRDMMYRWELPDLPIIFSSGILLQFLPHSKEKQKILFVLNVMRWWLGQQLPAKS